MTEQNIVLDFLIKRLTTATPHQQRVEVASLVRSARSILASGDILCVSIRYAVAGRARNTLRRMRDAGIVSFDCCMALQRALDY